MHEIEPYYRWRDKYIAAEDSQSPFYGRTYKEFYEQKVYNYYIHPEWDAFGSATLYLKILFTNYEEGYAIIEMIGEWNDCLHNDIMFLKTEVINLLIEEGIYKFILIGENVLNFHASDDCYYEEWYEDIKAEGGWICGINFLQHVTEEMSDTQLYYYMNFDEPFNDINWRPLTPEHFFDKVETMLLANRFLVAT